MTMGKMLEKTKTRALKQHGRVSVRRHTQIVKNTGENIIRLNKNESYI